MITKRPYCGTSNRVHADSRTYRGYSKYRCSNCNSLPTVEHSVGQSRIRGFAQKIRVFIFQREVFLFGSVYFFLALINLRVKLLLSPAWFDGTLERNHELLMQFDYTNWQQSRLLQFYIPEFFHNTLGISIIDAYILQRWLFVFLAFLCFHMFMRKWFSKSASFAGVTFLAAVMPLTYFNHLQESAPLLLLLFVLGLWAIRENKIVYLIVILLVGGLNNETMLFLPLVYFFYNYRSSTARDLAILSGKTLLVSLPLLITLGMIRYITRDTPVLGGGWHLYDNLYGIKSYLRDVFLNPLELYSARYLYIFLVFSVFWIYAFCKYYEKPLFLRRASLIIPFFILAHMSRGVITEARQMLPLSFVIIPMALFFLVKEEIQRDETSNYESKPP